MLAEIVEDVTVDLVETLFLFDRLFTKSRTATSPDYLKRVSDPSSKFCPDYLEYKHGRISRGELVGRLPNIAVLGDSLSRNMYISSVPSMFWRTRTERRRNWFLDTDSAPQSIYSLYEKLDKFTPLVATQYSSGGAKMGRENFIQKLGRTRNFSGQVNQVLRTKRFPDLLMIWIGHNNTNWVKIVPSTEREHPEKRLRQIARGFGEQYTEQLRLLIDRAKTENHKVVIVVFGLADFETFFKSRHEAETLHASNSKLYPYYPVSCKYFPALKPAYQKDTTRLGLMMNRELRTMVAHFNREIKDYSNLRLQYSDALWRVDLSRLERLHRMDAWHPSVLGHNILARAAFDAISPNLEFLGIKPHGNPSAKLGH